MWPSALEVVSTSGEGAAMAGAAGAGDPPTNTLLMQTYFNPEGAGCWDWLLYASSKGRREIEDMGRSVRLRR